MTDPIRGAFIAYRLAVEEFLTGREFPSHESIDDLARQYGEQITNEESLAAVQPWFCWHEITSYLEARKKGSDGLDK